MKSLKNRKLDTYCIVLTRPIHTVKTVKCILFIVCDYTYPMSMQSLKHVYICSCWQHRKLSYNTCAILKDTKQIVKETKYLVLKMWIKIAFLRSCWLRGSWCPCNTDFEDTVSAWLSGSSVSVDVDFLDTLSAY